MHNLLKNTLNFDNFKNIKLDLINKVNAFDSNDFHEENEVFNFLKDKKFVSDGLYFDAQGDTENTFSVKKRLKRIHDLKSYLNSIKNFRNNEKIKLNESKKENINVHERSVNFFSFSRNKNNDDIDKKQDIKNIVYLKNTLSQERRNKQGLTNKVFCKTLYKKIEKNEFEKKKYFQKFMLNISNIPENSSKKIVRITNSNRVNQKILVHHYYCKKGSLEKKNVKILEIRSKRKFSYMSFIKKHKSFIKEDKNLGISIKKFFLDNNNSNNNNQFKKNNGIPLEKKNNYLKSSLNKKESNKSTIKEVQNNMLKYDKISSYDRIKSLCERYDISNIKFPLFNNTENEDGVIKCKKKKIKSNELKKIKKCFQITKLDDTSKTSLSLKNTNLSIFRRMSTNNQYKNKKEVKRNKDIPFHFHSNNINFYETLVKKEKYIEESKNKDKYFFDKNVIQNNEMKEIKQKIQRTLISLNNIKKNNYKLKFCLEKEIIDNTIHHNELKRSICSLFNENILQRKNVEVSKNNQNKKNETNESNKNICNDNYTKVIKQRRESVDNGNNDIIENPFKGNTTLANNIKDKMDIIKGYNNSDFSGIKHTIIKEEQEGKNKISGDIKLLDNFENQRLLRIKCLTLNNKKQQNESVFIKDTAYKNSTKYNISSKIIKYNREPRYVTLEQNEDKHFFEQEKKKKKKCRF